VTKELKVLKEVKVILDQQELKELKELKVLIQDLVVL
jgi:hypothetical protein